MQIAFISDFFNIVGGAELNDEVLIQHLRKKFEVINFKSSPCKIPDLRPCDFIIVSNFCQLSDNVKQYIENHKSYIIYEHDHKYVSNRDPSRFKNFEIPEEFIINKSFYANAKKVVCLGSKQVDIIKKNLKIENLCSISSSLWSKRRLTYIRSLLNTTNKINRCAIFESSNPIKNTSKAVTYCIANKLDYDLISSPKAEDFLKKLASYKTLVFFPGVLESLCRLVVEAKMLDCKIITTPKKLGAYYEPWFSFSGSKLIDIIEGNIEGAFKIFEELISS